MSKKLHIYVIIIWASVLATAGLASAQSPWIGNDTIAHNIVWEERLSERIEFLSDTLCQGRATGSRGCSEAATWIIGRFRANGLMAFSGSYVKSFGIDSVAGAAGSDSAVADSVVTEGGVDPVRRDVTVGHNILAMLPGSWKKPSEKYLIVCAHYDHLGILGGRLYPGADSNASGVSAMLSLADMFSVMKKIGQKYGQNIIFVAFDAKEKNMAGAADLRRMIDAGELIDPQSGMVIGTKQISLVVNLDQIGSSMAPLKSGRKDYLIMLGGHTLKKDDVELLYMCNRFYNIGLELSETYYGSADFTRIFYGLSDHKIFADQGIPAVFFTSGITLNTFKTYDLPSSLDIPILRKRILLIYHWIEKMLR